MDAVALAIEDRHCCCGPLRLFRAQTIDDGAEAPDCGRVEQMAQRELDAESVADPRYGADAKQRLTAQLGEEVVARADVLDAQQRRPDARQLQLGGRARGDIALAQPAAQRRRLR